MDELKDFIAVVKMAFRLNTLEVSDTELTACKRDDYGNDLIATWRAKENVVLTNDKRGADELADEILIIKSLIRSYKSYKKI